MGLVFIGFGNSVTRICTITELVPPQAMTKPSAHRRAEGGLASESQIRPPFFSFLFPKTVEEVQGSIERLTFTTPHYVAIMTVNQFSQSASTISLCLKHRQCRCLYWANFRWKHRLYEESTDWFLPELWRFPWEISARTAALWCAFHS